MIEDITAFYELPESEPVGWLLQVPRETVADLKTNTILEEVKEWCDENLIEKYWIFDTMIGSPWYSRKVPVQFNFSTEQDYIFFKMRWM